VSAIDEVLARARRRDDVVTVHEAALLGLEPRALQRLATSARWQRLHDGVYVTHSGPPPWRTVARAAVAAAGAGAALSHAAAAFVHEFGGPPPTVVDVTVPHRRRVVDGKGFRVHRASRREIELRARLPVVSRADAALDLVQLTSDADGVVGVVTAAVRAGTWPTAIAEALARRPNTRNRTFVAELVRLVDEGIESALELRYHRDVERRHGLPAARLQRRDVVAGWWIRADRVYEAWGVRCELDGAFAHPGGRTDNDTWRDNAVLIERGEITLRYRWSHVAVTPCLTAAQVVAALRSRGWQGRPRPCRPTCPVR